MISTPNSYTAILKQDGDFWIGWVEEVPGVNAQERTKEAWLASLKERKFCARHWSSERRLLSHSVRRSKGSFLCARDAALAHPDNKLSGPPEWRTASGGEYTRID